MTRPLPRLVLPALLACSLLPLAARAAEEPVVSGSGTATIDKPADCLRLQVQIGAQGATLNEALAKLKTRRESVKAGLLKLGASDKTFDAGTTSIADGSSSDDRQSMIQRAMRERMAGHATSAPSQESPKVGVSTVIKAEWSLKSDTTEAMLVASNTIKDQIKSSKLLDAPKAPQSEAEEEAAMMAASDGNASPDEPLYTFVASISEAEQTKAMADAFAKAKTSATRLAKAAGSDLGALRSLDGRVMADPEEAMAMRQYGSSSYVRQMLMQRYGSNGTSDDKEAVGSQPGKVTIQVVVQASFLIK